MATKQVQVLVTVEYEPEDFRMAYGLPDGDAEAPNDVEGLVEEGVRARWAPMDWGRVVKVRRVPYGPLSVSASVRLGMICEAAEHKYRVRRLVPDGEPGAGEVWEGIARSIGDPAGNFVGPTDDVRGCYLRVTQTNGLGLDLFWSVATLMDEIQQGTFIPRDFG